jgi:hypothetical protein
MSRLPSRSYSAKPHSATSTQPGTDPSPGQRKSIYALTPEQLRTEIAAVISRQNQTYAALKRKEAIADAICESQVEKTNQADWEVGQLQTALSLQGDRKDNLMDLLSETETRGKKAEKTSAREKEKGTWK